MYVKTDEPTVAGFGQVTTTGIDLERATRLNRSFATSLGWGGSPLTLVRFLGPRAFFGDRARAEAVAEFQAKHGLKADGILGPVTWARMQQLAAPTASAAPTAPAAAPAVTTTPAPAHRRRSTQWLRDAWRDWADRTGSRMVWMQILGRRTPVNPRTQEAFAALSRALRTTGYPLTRTVWNWNWRPIKGSTRLSLHSYGLAVDIDHPCNPHRRGAPGPARFSARPTPQERCQDVKAGTADTIFTPEQVAAVESIQTRTGVPVFAWGGRWTRSPDTMHFQINVSPQELATGIVSRY